MLLLPSRFGAVSLVMILVLTTTTVASADHPAAEFDVAINHGRLVDPANQQDGLAHIGIRAGRIAVISDKPLKANRVIDASGLVVAPGFIDLHSHAMSSRGQEFQLQDGVTTALELEAGSYPVAALSGRFPVGARIHFGASSSHIAVRQRVLGNTYQPHFTDYPLPLDESAPNYPRAGLIDAANEPQIHAMMALHRQALSQGALGIGLPLDYLSKTVSDAELFALFEVAAEHNAIVFVHVRRGLPGDLSGLDDVLHLAEVTGAPVHICHLQASAMTGTRAAMTRISAARARGINVTTEAYPYNAGSTTINAAVFKRNWRDIFNIDYRDIQWAATGERLTEQTFNAYQKAQPNGFVVHHYGSSADTDAVLSDPGIMVASDAMPLGDNSDFAHPRGVGTFIRALSRYVDEFDAEGQVSLKDMIAKMTMLPGRLLASIRPELSTKGHLSLGADADVVILDPRQLDDRGTYLKPLQPSAGVEWLLVCGQVVWAQAGFVSSRPTGRNLNGDAPTCGDDRGD